VAKVPAGGNLWHEEDAYMPGNSHASLSRSKCQQSITVACCLPTAKHRSAAIAMNHSTTNKEVNNIQYLLNSCSSNITCMQQIHVRNA
jgi:hypothetical protein